MGTNLIYSRFGKSSSHLSESCSVFARAPLSFSSAPLSLTRTPVSFESFSVSSESSSISSDSSSVFSESSFSSLIKGEIFPKSPQAQQDVTLQLIFFDGEEAFKQWSRTDSLYGSRHLAEKWNKRKPFRTGEGSSQKCADREYVSYLDRIDVMVLLDLIGTANPKFYSYFLDTFSLYQQFVDAEQRLNSLKLLETHPPETETHYFSNRNTLAYIEDDHIPFMKRGVPIVHLIPSPFPHVWHRESDNRESLHQPTICNLNKVLRAFVAQYLHLEVTDSPLTV